MNIHERFLFSFLFSKKIFFISIKKSAIGLQNVHQKVFLYNGSGQGKDQG